MRPEEIVASLTNAWNAGDGDRWASAFADDAVFVDVLGRVQRGRQVIADEHQKIFDTIYRGSRLDIRIEASQQLDDRLILAHTTSTLDVPEGPRAGITTAIQTKLIRDGLILGFQNTIRAEAAQFAGHDPDLAALAPLGWQGTDGS